MNIQKRSILVLAFSVFALLSFSACTSIHAPSGYLSDYSTLAKGKEFKQERVNPEADFSRYTKAKVEEPVLKYFENPNHEYDDADIQRMASTLKLSLENQLAKKYQVLGDRDRPDSKTIVVKPALIFATSPERLLNALTAWFIGFQFSKGKVAFEAKLEDGGTDKELIAVAEQRKGGGGITDLKSLLIGGFFRFMHIDGAFSRWGKNFVDLTEAPAAA